MRTTLNLETVEEKKTKTGKSYVRINEKINCFDVKICEKLRANVGKDVSLELEESNGYNNVKAFYGDGVVCEAVKPKMTLEEARNNKDQMMMVSYAKDIWIANLGAMVAKDIALEKGWAKDYMEAAIDLVKQARDGLK